MSTHTQCDLRRGTERQVAYIPSQYATVGQTVKLRTNGNWSDGWDVVGSFNEMDSREVRERSEDYRNTRKASDI